VTESTREREHKRGERERERERERRAYLEGVSFGFPLQFRV